MKVRIPIWLFPVGLGAAFVMSGEDPGLALPFAIGPAVVAWIEGHWRHRTAIVEGKWAVKRAETEGLYKFASAAVGDKDEGDSEGSDDAESDA